MSKYIFPEPYTGSRPYYKIREGHALYILIRSGAWRPIRCWITSPPYYKQVDYEVDGQLGQEGTSEQYINNLTSIAYEMREESLPDANLFMVIRDSYSGSGGPGGDSVRADGTRKKKPHRGAREAGVPNQAMLMIPQRLSIAFARIGWWLKQDIIWNKQNALSAAQRRLSYSYEHILHFVLDPENNYFNRDAILRPPAESSKGQLESEYCGEGQRDYEGMGREDPSNKKRRAIKAMQKRGGNCLLLDVWDISRQPSPKIESMPDYYHKASFPLELAEICVLFGSKEGDWIGDPFCGSGTTLFAALKWGRKAFGIELNPEDIAAAKARIKETFGE